MAYQHCHAARMSSGLRWQPTRESRELVTSVGYYSSERRELLPYLPSHLGSVLELGCSEGHHGRLLLRRGRATSVVGVDLYVPSDKASEHLSRFIRSDVVTWLNECSETFNTVLALDILEHLEDPWTALSSISTILEPGGTVVASIPNIRFWKVIGDLLVKGRFDYQDQGILDRTHLRFFTRRSILQLFKHAGLTEVEVLRLRYPNQSKWRRLGAVALRDLGCKQFVVLAKSESAT
jgi:2-polyprenyl-3-methyl-5-hydroxy-6-metoxy-1,4-benzoquinol methylase